MDFDDLHTQNNLYKRHHHGPKQTMDKKSDSAATCISCNQLCTKLRPGHKACLTCINGNIHQICLQDLVMGRGHNRCPRCMNPMVLTSENNNLLVSLQSLRWYMTSRNQCLCGFILLLTIYLAVLIIHLLFRGIMVGINKNEFVHQCANSSIIIPRRDICVDSDASSFGESLFCYFILGFSPFDFIWSFVIWISCLLVVGIIILMLNMFQLEQKTEQLEEEKMHKSKSAPKIDRETYKASYDEESILVLEVSQSSETRNPIFTPKDHRMVQLSSPIISILTNLVQKFIPNHGSTLLQQPNEEILLNPMEMLSDHQKEKKSDETLEIANIVSVSTSSSNSKSEEDDEDVSNQLF